MKRFILVAIILVTAFHSRAQSNATEIEYFLDTDNGFGLNTVLNITTPDTDITQQVLADIPLSTEIGYHKLYIRVKDINGNWSHTTRKNIEVVAPLTQNNIIMGEYFLDQDPGFDAGTAFSINPENEDIEQQFSAQILATTELGYHKLYGRVKDSKGNWSQTFRKNIEVYENPVTNLVEIEYFFEDDLGFGSKSIEPIGTPAMDGKWTFNVPYPEGNFDINNEFLFIRVKDSNGNWSITTTVDEIVTLGTENWIQKSTLVYPNPFNDNLFIDIQDDIQVNTINIYNMLGKRVYQTNFESQNIDLTVLSKGIYMMQLDSDQGKATFKIIKQ